jgi:hypothetical protein
MKKSFPLPSENFNFTKFLGDLAQFYGPGLPVLQFLIGQLHFFIKTNNDKGLLLQQRLSNCCFELPRWELQTKIHG